MKYPQFICVLLLAFTLVSFSKEKLNRDVDELHLKGTVKSVMEIKQTIPTSTDTTASLIIGPEYSKKLRRFNPHGNLIDVLQYGPDDSVVLKQTNEYKHHGQKRITYLQNFGIGPKHKRWDEGYMENGKWVQFEKAQRYRPHDFDQGGRIGVKQKEKVYLYDKNGRLAKLIYFTPGGLRSTVSEYDGLGNRCSVTQFSRHNGWPHKTRISYNYVYDSLGRLTEERNINEDGSLLNKYIHKYDKKGNEIETDIFNTDSTLSRKISAQFDSLGNPVDVNDAYYFVGGGDVGQKRNATYDDNGFKTEEETYRIKADGTVVLIKATVYENDKIGNWIKATSFDNNKKGSVETRVIEYY